MYLLETVMTRSHTSLLPISKVSGFSILAPVTSWWIGLTDSLVEGDFRWVASGDAQAQRVFNGMVFV